MACSKTRLPVKKQGIRKTKTTGRRCIAKRNNNNNNNKKKKKKIDENIQQIRRINISSSSITALGIRLTNLIAERDSPRRGSSDFRIFLALLRAVSVPTHRNRGSGSQKSRVVNCSALKLNTHN